MFFIDDIIDTGRTDYLKNCPKIVVQNLLRFVL